MHDVMTHYDDLPAGQYAWTATSKDYEPGDFIGSGRTKAEAIEDYLTHMEHTK